MTTTSNKRRLVLQGMAAAALAGTSALGTAAEERTLRIGYQKFNTLNILKGTGNLEKALQPLGWKVKWFVFAAGPQLTEALNLDAIDFGHAADTPSAFANAASRDSSCACASASVSALTRACSAACRTL